MYSTVGARSVSSACREERRSEPAELKATVIRCSQHASLSVGWEGSSHLLAQGGEALAGDIIQGDVELQLRVDPMVALRSPQQSLSPQPLPSQKVRETGENVQQQVQMSQGFMQARRNARRRRAYSIAL